MSGRRTALSRPALAAAMLVIVVLQIACRDMAVAGDEPEYIYYAYSLLLRHDLSMPLSQFGRAFPLYASIPDMAFRQYGHPVLIPLLASPLVGLFGTAGARLFSVVAGLIGFVAVARLLADIVGPRRSVLVALFVFATFPVLAYAHVFYMDIFVMTVAAWSWLLIQSTSRRDLLLAALLAVLLPFVHVRSAPIAAWLFALALLGGVRDTGGQAGRVRMVAAILGVGLVAALVFAWHQHVLYGALVAGATATFVPGPALYLPRLAVQLLSFRHGLVTVNPAMLLALAGLAIGIARRDRLAVEAGGMILLYSFAFVWGTASESYPARFWVPVMPALAVGLAIWAGSVRSRAALVAGAVLGVLSLLNVVMFLGHPLSFLSNRTASVTYDRMFGWFHVVDLAGLFPWDVFDYAARGVEPHPELDRLLLISASAGALLIVACFAIEAMVPRHGRLAGRVIALLPACALLVPLHAATMRKLPSHSVQIVHDADGPGHRGSILMTFCRPFDVRMIRYLGRPRELLGPPAYPAVFHIDAAQDGAPLAPLRAVPTSPVILLPPGRYSAIRLWATPSEGRGAWALAPVEILTAGLFRQRC